MPLLRHYSAAMTTVLVTGATGNVGGELVRQLADSSIPVRGLARRAGVALPRGVEGVHGDLNEAASVADALRGVSAVFLLAGYDSAGLLTQMRAAGVERVVVLSGGGASARDTDNVVSRYQLATEEAARASGLVWTVLRPYGFMTNSLRWRPQLEAGDVVRLPFAATRVVVIDPADIAAVAARTLIDNGHDGRIYRLSGPESLLPAEQVDILGSALGRPLRFEAQPNDEAYAEMTRRMPKEYADALFAFSTGALDESEVLPTVADVSGRPPRSFRDWADRHADAFAS
jgi:uncharacterized protein YbjT (DUF2867 family)